MKTPPLLTVAEYFAGIGLMRLGLEQAGWTTLFANDIDDKKRQMYRHHFGSQPEPAPEDVHLLDSSTVPSTLLATASFPCNDLSLAGGRRGLAGENSSAFWGFIRVLKEMGNRRPPLVLLENVVGFLTSRDGADFLEALLALNELGYVVDAFIVDAARFVPQSRQRLFVIGRRTPINGGDPRSSRVGETIGMFESDARPSALADFILWHPEVQWDLRPLPELPRHDRTLADIVEDLPLNSAAWWSLARREYLLNQMSPKHRAMADAMIRGSRRTFATVFRRVRAAGSMAELRTDGIAGCLRTPRGGSGRQILFVAGKGRFGVRLLTGRECARLMGADDFRLNVPLNQALFGFGDAVCVPVIRWIAENYLNPVAAELNAETKQAPDEKLSIRYGTFREARKQKGRA
jgi:DNA (cytosine-5)-methyltransferase 1